MRNAQPLCTNRFRNMLLDAHDASTLNARRRARCDFHLGRRLHLNGSIRRAAFFERRKTRAIPHELLQRPFLRPIYDDPQFVLRSLWRRYGGWWDGNPAHLLPPRERALAAEVAALAGGAAALAARAQAVAGDDLALACQLVEWAGAAAPGAGRGTAR